MFLQELLHIGDEDISVRYYEVQNTSECVLWLHGAGSASQERFVSMCNFLQKQGIASVTFDYSGHGQSSCNSISSIAKKTFQAKEVFKKISSRYTKIHIFAFSMSGQIAINVLQSGAKVHSLVFFSPALYSVDVFDIPFDKRFTDAIRQKGNWNNSNISQVLPHFSGKISLIRPLVDVVIPEEVFDLYRAYSPVNNFGEYIIQDAPHTLGAWMSQNSDRFGQVFHFLTERKHFC